MKTSTFILVAILGLAAPPPFARCTKPRRRVSVRLDMGGNVHVLSHEGNEAEVDASLRAVILVAALAFVGIRLTFRGAGPARALSRALKHLAEGRLDLADRITKRAREKKGRLKAPNPPAG
ncbi:MAG: hypothetical protein ISR64_11530 [Deltaproteobacteria bacterium]|nr:hypothetical protein [Deltaproteobacteria bacterium]